MRVYTLVKEKHYTRYLIEWLEFFLISIFGKLFLVYN